MEVVRPVSDSSIEVQLAKIQKDYEYLKEKCSELQTYNKELSANLKKIEEDILDLYHLLDSAKTESGHCKLNLHSKVEQLQAEMEGLKKVAEAFKLANQRSVLKLLLIEVFDSKVVALVVKILKILIIVLLGILSAKGLISLEWAKLWK